VSSTAPCSWTPHFVVFVQMKQKRPHIQLHQLWAVPDELNRDRPSVCAEGVMAGDEIGNKRYMKSRWQGMVPQTRALSQSEVIRLFHEKLSTWQ